MDNTTTVTITRVAESEKRVPRADKIRPSRKAAGSRRSRPHSTKKNSKIMGEHTAI